MLSMLLILVAVNLKPKSVKTSPFNYLSYLIFTLGLAISVSLLNLQYRSIQIIIISVMVMDISVSIYLHSNIRLRWLTGVLFNILGTVTAFAFYY